MSKFGSDYLSPYTFKAAGVIAKGEGVKLTSNEGEVEACDTQGEAMYGVAMQSADAAGDPVAVLRRGRFDRAIAGAALATPHTELTMGADARFEPAATGDIVVGINLTTAAADGDEFCLEIDLAQRVTP